VGNGVRRRRRARADELRGVTAGGSLHAPRRADPLEEEAMKNRGFSVAMAALSLMALAGCKNRDRTSPTPTDFTPGETRVTSAEAGASPVATAVVKPAPLEREDREFLTKAAQGSMLEVAVGNAVAQKATTPDVKAFASRMVTDHGKALAELQQIAAKKGVALPTDLDKDHKKRIDEVTKHSGPKLDKEYADDMVEDHEEDVKEFRRAVQEVKDPDLHAWASKTLPVLENHLTMARDLKAKTKR
jgi:putative membrane protein